MMGMKGVKIRYFFFLGFDYMCSHVSGFGSLRMRMRTMKESINYCYQYILNNYTIVVSLN